MKWTIKNLAGLFLTMTSTAKNIETTTDANLAFNTTDEGAAWQITDTLNCKGGDYKKEWTVEPYWPAPTELQTKYNDRYTEIEAKIERLKQLLVNERNSFNNDSKNWGYLGNLGHIDENLDNLLAGFQE